MKKELREIENYGLKILTEKAKDGSMTVYAKFSEAEKKNQNFRIYPLEILSREVDRLQSKISSGQFLGQSDHSDSPATFLKDVSHVVTGLEMKGNNGYATIKILNTSAGKNVQEIIRGKGKIGISTRSVGSVDAKTGIVQKDLRLLALDLVANPSVADATIGKENILEGIEFDEDNGDKELEKEIDELEKESYLNAVNAGFVGSQKDWLQNVGSLKEAMGIPVEKGTSEVEKLTDETISKKVYSFYQEAVNAGYRGTLNEWKEKFPGIVASASEPRKIVENKPPVSKVPWKSSVTWSEIKESGFIGSMDEYKEKFPNITIILPESPQKPVVETLEQEAQRIFEGLKKDNPNSSLTLESVTQMLYKEGEGKRARKERELAAFRVSRSLAGSGSALSQAQLEKMVQEELEIIREQKAEKKRKNWEAYKRLLSD